MRYSDNSTFNKFETLKPHLSIFRGNYCFWAIILFAVGFVTMFAKGVTYKQTEAVLLGYENDEYTNIHGGKVCTAYFRGEGDEEVLKVKFASNMNNNKTLNSSDIGKKLSLVYEEFRLDPSVILRIMLSGLGIVYLIVVIGAYFEVYHGCGFLLEF